MNNIPADLARHGYLTSSHPSVKELKRLRDDLRVEITRLDIIVGQLDQFIEKEEKKHGKLDPKP